MPLSVPARPRRQHRGKLARSRRRRTSVAGYGQPYPPDHLDCPAAHEPREEGSECARAPADRPLDRAGGRGRAARHQAQAEEGARGEGLRPPGGGRDDDRAGPQGAPHLPQARQPARAGRQRARPREAGPRRRGDRGRDRPWRLGDRDGRREGAGAADEGLRRVRDDPAAERPRRRRRPRALREDHRRRGPRPRRRDLLRLPRRPVHRGRGVIRAPRRAGHRAQRRADQGPVRGHDRGGRAGRARPPRRRLVRVDDDVPDADRAAAGAGRPDRARRLLRMVGLPHGGRRVLQGP